MIRHIVLFRFKETTTPEDVARLEAAISPLPRMIPEIRRYSFGPDVTGDEGNWDFGLAAEFDDVAGYETYRDDERHREIITGTIRPLISERAAVQVGW